MPKKNLSSLEIAALVNELQFLVHGKISQIYNEEETIILQLHAINKGKQLLKIIPGKLFCLTEEKEAPERPSGFCQLLRKYLDGAIINSISQKDTERIVILEVEKSVFEDEAKSKHKYFIVLELYSKGNVILTDSDWIIIGALEQIQWKDREIKVKLKYIFPTPSLNYKQLTLDQLRNVLHDSEKKNVSTSLAMEFGFGGLYAEEVCALAKVDKEKAPKEVTKTEREHLLAVIQQMLEQIKKPQGYVYENDIAPFTLLDKPVLKLLPTYNEAINTLNINQKISPFEKKIKSVQAIISTQEEAITSAQDKIAENKRKGELVYENYASIQKMLQIVAEMRKTKEWKEVSAELSKNKKVIGVDLKSKKVTLDL